MVPTHCYGPMLSCLWMHSASFINSPILPTAPALLPVCQPNAAFILSPPDASSPLPSAFLPRLRFSPIPILCFHTTFHIDATRWLLASLLVFS